MSEPLREEGDARQGDAGSLRDARVWLDRLLATDDQAEATAVLLRTVWSAMEACGRIVDELDGDDLNEKDAELAQEALRIVEDQMVALDAALRESRAASSLTVPGDARQQAAGTNELLGDDAKRRPCGGGTDAS